MIAHSDTSRKKKTFVAESVRRFIQIKSPRCKMSYKFRVIIPRRRLSITITYAGQHQNRYRLFEFRNVYYQDHPKSFKTYCVNFHKAILITTGWLSRAHRERLGLFRLELIRIYLQRLESEIVWSTWSGRSHVVYCVLRALYCRAYERSMSRSPLPSLPQLKLSIVFSSKSKWTWDGTESNQWKLILVTW